MRKIERVDNGIVLDGVVIGIEIDRNIVNSMHGYDVYDLIKELTNIISMKLDNLTSIYNFSDDERAEIIRLLTNLRP